MREAEYPDYRDYPTFNDFFTRYLRPEFRPIANHPSELACPVDGVVSALGELANNQILQAKGKYYSLQSLLAGKSVESFINGSFFTAYLAPKDYHRIHMPYEARLIEMHYIPGSLFSVNAKSVAAIDNLFARNERVISVFESDFGPFALIAVGAMIVGSIATAWHGVVNPGHSRQIFSWYYQDKDIRLARGDEWGYFKLGSTVILLFPQYTVNWQRNLMPLSYIKMGHAIGNLNAKGVEA
jgi:phosphatidylserine decarboxylase